MRPGERQEGANGAPLVMPEASDPLAESEAPVTGDTVASYIPEVPEAVKAAARRAPGHWVGVVDPEWTEERTPAEWAVLGEWQSDESGSVGEYRANPAYRPSARMLGWPDPTDPVDAAAQQRTSPGSADRTAGRSRPPGWTGRRWSCCSPRPHTSSCRRHFTMTPCRYGNWPAHWRVPAPC